MDIEYLLYQLGDLASVLPLLALAGLGLWWWTRRAAQQSEELQPAGDAMRYALASAVLKGSLFRQRVLKIARNRYRAIAPELGIDFPLLVRACRHYEMADRSFAWAIGGLLASIFVLPIGAGFVADVFDAYELAYDFLRVWTPLTPLVALAVLGLAIYKRWRERFVLVNAFRRENYDAEHVRRTLPDSGADNLLGASSLANVVCYGVVDPFVGLGRHFNSWQFAVDVTRPATEGVAPRSFDIDEVYAALEQNVRDLHIPNLEVRDVIFVNGSESDQIPEIQNDRYERPAPVVGPQVVSLFRRGADPRARAYRWITITEWGGELVFSYLYRCVRRGEALCIEAVQLVLPPVNRSFREIDSIRRLRFLGMLGWIMVSVAMAPVMVLGSFVSILNQVREFVADLFGGEDAAERREIHANPAYNYGARESIRAAMASQAYHVYFQRVDGVQYFSAVDQQVTNALLDFLEARGVDVSALRMKSEVVVNSGVMIGAGATVIGAAAGAGAQASAAPSPVAGAARAAARAAARRS